MTPREIQIVLQGVIARQKRAFRDQCRLAYSAAWLHWITVHNPGKMPKFEDAFPEKAAVKKEQSPDQIMAVMQAWTSHLNGQAPKH